MVIRPDAGAPLTYFTVEALVKKHIDRLKACVEQTRLPPGTYWAVDLRWIVAPDGSTSRFEADSTNTNTPPELRTCILDEVKGWSFPPSPEGLGAAFMFNPYSIR
jgi:hypothetical protein